ncbi:MAG: MBL fold metallo-hydrolase [Gammaproteobacteria bacterium]|nr:MBL fold metallo-hydrolase [Gammaproteobacteria bacterium]
MYSPRRKFLVGALGAVTLGITSSAYRSARAATATELLLLGTQGGPNFNLTRGETASALLVDGAVYLVDCGYGTLSALARAGLSYRFVDQIFLTHLHDDHCADVVTIVGHQWTAGRTEPTFVHGPAGTTRLLDAALAYNALNEEIRTVDEARALKMADLFHANDIPASAKPVAVMRDERVTVTACENTHYPEESKARMPHRAISYRFDTASRSVVFSGDTSYSDNLVALARGADVLVCEAMDVPLTRKAFEAKVADGEYAENPEGVWHHIAGTHTSTEDAGRMAAAAGVDTLVLNHLLPGALGAGAADEVYIEAVRRHFSGRVIVGSDQMRI